MAREAVELIKCFEGIPDGDPTTVNINPYLCPAAYWTSGALRGEFSIAKTKDELAREGWSVAENLPCDYPGSQ